ncbi:hypothetical protein T4C_7780, partial [Trichinella pseudospiralis]
LCVIAEVLLAKYFPNIWFKYFTTVVNCMSMRTEDLEELPHAIADFFEWFVHQILFYREVYPQESFEMVKFCNYPCYKSSCPYVIDYIREWHSILSATCEPGEITVIIQIEDPAMRKKLIERYYLRIFIRGSQESCYQIGKTLNIVCPTLSADSYQ